MKQLYYCRIANIKSGLCNQLFALINGIILAERKKSKIVILGLFLNDYSRNNVTPISQIIDLPKFNMFVLQNYGIHIMDKTDTKLSIHNVTYGTQDHHIDITQIVIDKFYKNNTLLIDTNINLNLLAGNDPSSGKVKYIEITYSLNNITLIDKYREQNGFLKEKIYFNLNNKVFNYDMGWINTYNKSIFDDILKNIVFFKNIILPENEHSYISKYNKINVIHLRIEVDAILHWSKMNKMSALFFQNYIEQKYINIIKKYINKNELTVLLTYSNNNNVIQYLKQNEYNYYISPKIDKWGREINAIKDASIIGLCNNVFIGNFNLQNLNGSSLSYYLLNKLRPNVKCITIDLDKILMDEKSFITH
jgi:hypothetical protein